MSSVCDWARLDLCHKPQGPASLIKCDAIGCGHLLHHMCQSIWESEDEAIREAHGSRKCCTHHHPALADGKNHAETGPLATIQGCSQSTMETMPTLTTATSLPSMPNINIAAQLFHDKDADVQEFNILQEDENDDEARPPLKHIWDCAYVEKNPPTGWKCLWCSDLFVPVHATRALYHVAYA
jgi:hypothetical protein